MFTFFGAIAFCFCVVFIKTCFTSTRQRQTDLEHGYIQPGDDRTQYNTFYNTPTPRAPQIDPTPITRNPPTSNPPARPAPPTRPVAPTSSEVLARTATAGPAAPPRPVAPVRRETTPPFHSNVQTQAQALRNPISTPTPGASNPSLWPFVFDDRSLLEYPPGAVTPTRRVHWGPTVEYISQREGIHIAKNQSISEWLESTSGGVPSQKTLALTSAFTTPKEPQPVSRNIIHPRPLIPPPPKPKSSTTVSCYICLDTLPPSSVLPAPCKDHWCCFTCLARFFNYAAGDETLFPPSCCDKPWPQSTAFLVSILTPDDTLTFVTKAKEYKTPIAQRVYCSLATCGSFLPNDDPDGPPHDKCGSCGTRTCRRCKDRAHDGTRCQQKGDGYQILKRLAEVEGWIWCQKCGICVELLGGCNHMTCRCGHQFCYICGMEWKTCHCTSETPRLGLLGERLRELRALREINAPVLAPRALYNPANMRNDVTLRQYRPHAQLEYQHRALVIRETANPPNTPTQLRVRRPAQLAPQQPAPVREATPHRVPPPRTPHARQLRPPECHRPPRVTRCSGHTWRRQQQAGECERCKMKMPWFIMNCVNCEANWCEKCTLRD